MERSVVPIHNLGRFWDAFELSFDQFTNYMERSKGDESEFEHDLPLARGLTIRIYLTELERRKEQLDRRCTVAVWPCVNDLEP